MSNEKNKLVLIDGHSILNRAFYGVPDLTNSEGFHTNAIYGFLNIMFKILEEEHARYLVVAFDVKAPTFRHTMYQEYKATRGPSPKELHEQVPVMKELLNAMGITIVELSGYEADDVIGTLAKRAEREGYSVSVVSGDKDLLQLATEHVKIRIPKTKRGVTEVEDYHARQVAEKYMVTPQEFIDVKALMGDSSDNIPGVPGIGEKTAVKIISEFKSIENAYEHIDSIMPNKARESLRTHYDKAQMSKKLATINTEAPVELNLNEAELGNLYTEKAYQLMNRLEFKTILNKFEVHDRQPAIQTDFQTIDELIKVESIFNNAFCSERLGVEIVFEEKLLGIALSFEENKGYFIPIGGFITEHYIEDKLTHILRNHSLVCFNNLKKHLKFTTDIYEYNGNCFDVQIACYLLNPLKDTYHYDDIARDYLKITVPSQMERIGKTKLSEAMQTMPEDFLNYICMSAYVSYSSFPTLKERLEVEHMYELFTDIEMPLLYALNNMENVGVRVEKEALKTYGDALQLKIDEIEVQIYDEVGMQFNINSPKQLGEILFDKMKIKGGKKTKTGYSTSADILEKLAPDYPVIHKILEYRQLTKLKSTYADGLANYIGDDGRIHGQFNQTVTATGRISSTEPNLQNIPIRMEIGRLIRKVFVPEQDYLFIDADYSQIELRILAHISGDENLIEAYNGANKRSDLNDQNEHGDPNDQNDPNEHDDQNEHSDHLDIHRITASKVFHTPLEDVTETQRSNAKAVNFGIVYGISSFGLSQDLSISRSEANEYINQYFQTYPGIKVFMDESVKSAKDNGFVRTLFHRKRPIPELKSGNYMQRSFGERIAMNSPIQGTAADIMKIAMVRVDQRFREKKLRSRIVLQVHDEFLVEAHKEEIETVKSLLKEEMCNAALLRVPLEVSIGVGTNWFEAH